MFEIVAERGRRRRRVRELEGQISALRAEQVRELAALAGMDAHDGAGPVGVVGDDQSVQSELSAYLTWTEYRSGRALAEASRLTSCLPRTLAALGEGRIDFPMAQVVVTGVQDLGEDDAAAVDEAVDPVLGTLTTGGLRARVAVEAQAVDAAAAHERHLRGVRDRHVEWRPDGDGLATLCAVGPAVDVLAKVEDLRRQARTLRREPGETRTVANLQFDLLTEVSIEPTKVTTATEPATRSGRERRPPAALVQVTVSLPTLRGADEAPAELAGYGPVPAQVARDLAAGESARLRRLVTDPVTGTLLAVDGHTHPPSTPDTRGGGSAAVPRQRISGATSATPPDRPGQPDGPAAHGVGRHDPPAGMERFVKARDQRCTVPWCRQPASRCDVDHVVAYPSGPTCPCNLHPLCRRHHRTKQSPGWTVQRDRDGTTTWTTPTGLTATTPPTPVLPQPTVTVRPPPPPPPPPWTQQQDQEQQTEQALERAAISYRFRSSRQRDLDEADRAADWTDAQFDRAVARLLTEAEQQSNVIGHPRTTGHDTRHRTRRRPNPPTTTSTPGPRRPTRSWDG